MRCSSALTCSAARVSALRSCCMRTCSHCQPNHPPPASTSSATSQASADEPRRCGAVESGGAGVLKRSEEHTSELQSLMRISYAVFCLKKKKKNQRDDR